MNPNLGQHSALLQSLQYICIFIGEGGRSEDACDHGLSRGFAEGKISCALTWRVKVDIKSKNKNRCPVLQHQHKPILVQASPFQKQGHAPAATVRPHLVISSPSMTMGAQFSWRRPRIFCLIFHVNNLPNLPTLFCSDCDTRSSVSRSVPAKSDNDNVLIVKFVGSDQYVPAVSAASTLDPNSTLVAAKPRPSPPPSASEGAPLEALIFLRDLALLHQE